MKEENAMNQLINITNENGNKAVSARELYLGLGLNKVNWARWCQTNIIEGDYFKCGADWVGVLHNEEGNDTMDFAISIDFAKHIAMMAKTEKSHDYRNYFLECEKEVTTLKPMSQAELTAAIAQNQVEIERTANTALEIATKASRQITDALDIFTTPLKDDWRHEMNKKVDQMCFDHGLSYLQFRHDIYAELENTARVDLNSRQLRLRKRMKASGSTFGERQAISKIDIIERDPKLRPIFEGIVRKYQAKYAAV
jgi:anti-repressor protein